MVNRTKTEIDMAILSACIAPHRLTKLTQLLNLNAPFAKSRLIELEKNGLILSRIEPKITGQPVKLVDAIDCKRVYQTTKHGKETIQFYNEFQNKYGLSVKVVASK